MNEFNVSIYPEQANSVPESLDLMSMNRFRVIIAKFPIVEYFTQRLPLPSIDLGTTIKPTNKGYDYKVPGDKLEFSDLSISFLIDENLQGMKEITNWMYDIVNEQNDDNIFSDITISILDNNMNYNKKIVFYNCFPSSLTGGSLDVSDEQEQSNVIDVMFKYSNFDIL